MKWKRGQNLTSELKQLNESCSLLTSLLDVSPTFLTGATATGGIALINSVGNLGGLVGPTIMGQMEGLNRDYTVGYLSLVVAMLLGGGLVLTVRNRNPESDTKSEFDPKKWD